MSPRRLGLIAVALVALAALPVALPTSSSRAVLVFICINTMLSLGLQLVMGYAGQISLGQSAFFGIGAYGYGILTVKAGLNPWLALVAAALLNAVIAYGIGAPILRLAGHQLALATLAFSLIVVGVFTQASDLTGGAIGLRGIPNLWIGGFKLGDDLRNAYLTEAVALVLLVLSHNLMGSRVGRAWRALSASAPAAESLGVNVPAHKLHVFTLSAVYSSLAGSLYAAYLTFISPDPFSVYVSVQILLMAAVGGLATVWGAPVGAAFIVLLGQALNGLARGLPSGTETILDNVVYGLILVGIMLVMPNGVTRAAANLVSRFGGRGGRLGPSRTPTVEPLPDSVPAAPGGTARSLP